MEKIDLTSIQYVPETPVETKDKELPQDFGERMKDVQQMIKHENNDSDPAEKMDKQRLILILKFYVLEFKDKLSEYKNVDFEQMEYNQLKELRKEFDTILSCKSSIKATQTMILNSIRMIEMMATTFTPIQCQGLSTIMCNDEDVKEDIKHISLKHLAMAQIDPEIRLGYKMLQNILLLHNLNSSQINVQSKPNEKLNQINEKYCDL